MQLPSDSRFSRKRQRSSSIDDSSCSEATVLSQIPRRGRPRKSQNEVAVKRRRPGRPPKSQRLLNDSTSTAEPLSPSQTVVTAASRCSIESSPIVTLTGLLTPSRVAVPEICPCDTTTGSLDGDSVQGPSESSQVSSPSPKSSRFPGRVEWARGLSAIRKKMQARRKQIRQRCRESSRADCSAKEKSAKGYSSEEGNSDHFAGISETAASSASDTIKGEPEAEPVLKNPADREMAPSTEPVPVGLPLAVAVDLLPIEIVDDSDDDVLAHPLIRTPTCEEEMVDPWPCVNSPDRMADKSPRSVSSEDHPEELLGPTGHRTESGTQLHCSTPQPSVEEVNFKVSPAHDGPTLTGSSSQDFIIIVSSENSESGSTVGSESITVENSVNSQSVTTAGSINPESVTAVSSANSVITEDSAEPQVIVLGDSTEKRSVPTGDKSLGNTLRIDELTFIDSVSKTGESASVEFTARRGSIRPSSMSPVKIPIPQEEPRPASTE